jgi:alkylated DNA repair dioxygenase AlkB
VSQRSLFGGPEPVRPDVHLQRQYLAHDHAVSLFDSLAESLAWEQRSITRFDQTVPMPRMECWLSVRPGAVYTYSGVRYEAQDLGRFSEPLMMNELVSAASRKAGHYGFNAVFANLYRTGQDSIGWHADDEPVLGPTRDVVIASLSLGARRRFVMKRRDDPNNRHEWSLGEGDLLIMGPGCQSDWLHSVPKTAKPVGPRLNLTFRRVGG